MFYTVISKSGWQGDSWKIQKTFKSRKDAEEFKERIFQRRDPTHDHYHVQVKAHRKALTKLLTAFDTIRFSDGTEAIPDW